jgi:hypothetical protein
MRRKLNARLLRPLSWLFRTPSDEPAQLGFWIKESFDGNVAVRIGKLFYDQICALRILFAQFY